MKKPHDRTAPQPVAPQQGKSLLSTIVVGGLLGSGAYLLLTKGKGGHADALRDLLGRVANAYIQAQRTEQEAHERAHQERAWEASWQTAWSPPPPDPELEARAAAALLGVSLDAAPDAIRAALRSKMARSRLHPDHGGDGTEARTLIAAKNLLIERARGHR